MESQRPGAANYKTKPETNMDISITLLDDKQINPGQRIPITAMHTGRELVQSGRAFCHWFPGSPNDEIEGKDILIAGKEYIIGHRRYDLASGYAIRARLTPKLTLIPRLRKAVGKEIEIVRDNNNFPINQYWPIIECIQDKHIPAKKVTNQIGNTYDFVQDAMDALSESTNLTETFGPEEQ